LRELNSWRNGDIIRIDSARFLRDFLCAALLLSCAPVLGRAEQIPVRHVEGSKHGFLAVRNQDGVVIASGDLSQTAHGDRVSLHLVFHFKDGSIDDETTLFSQRRTFQLISDHHIQKGPFFPHPEDVLIDVPTGQVTVRSIGKDGKEEVEATHMDLPPDLANGLVSMVAMNVLPKTQQTEVPMLIASPKLRMVKLVFTPRGEEPFSVAGSEMKAMRFNIKIDLGGLAAVVAPVIGKQPPDLQMWVLEGPAPTFVKEEGMSYQGGPILTIELASPVWPRNPDSRIAK
jgi:hypothetical protein